MPFLFGFGSRGGDFRLGMSGFGIVILEKLFKIKQCKWDRKEKQMSPRIIIAKEDATRTKCQYIRWFCCNEVWRVWRSESASSFFNRINVGYNVIKLHKICWLYLFQRLHLVVCWN
jgi:hypothetical protein